MIRSYEHGWRKFKPTLRLICSILSFLMFFVEFILAIFEYVESRHNNILAAVFSGIFLFHSILSFLYFIGSIRMVSCMQIPLLTIQLIFVSGFLFFIILWSLATILAFFDLFHEISPIKGIRNGELFVAVEIFLVAVFIISAKFSLILYKGFKQIEDENRYRFCLVNGGMTHSYVSNTNTIPPTEV